MIEVILQFSFSLHELQRLMIHVDDCLLPDNVISLFLVVFHYVVQFFVVSRVLTDNI